MHDSVAGSIGRFPGRIEVNDWLCSELPELGERPSGWPVRNGFPAYSRHSVVAITSATPPLAPPPTMLTLVPGAPPPPGTISPGSTRPPAPTGSPSSSHSSGSVRLRIAHWMEKTFGRAYLPVAMLAGGAVGGTAGALTLGPIGGIAGGLGGALLGGVLVFAG